MINHAWQFVISKLKIHTGPIWTASSRLITFLAVVIAWVFFRAPDIRTAVDILGAMVGMNGISLPRRLEHYADLFQNLPITPSFNGIQWINFGEIGVPVLLTAILIAWFSPNTQEIFSRYEPCLEKVVSPESTINRYFRWTPSKLTGVVFAAIFVICILNMNQVTEFLYFQF
ncbi:hypothetical protein [Nitrosomonas europaea]|uniref:hypothetical protein n=1 Tax=Nitrosomonas europaea TaxID=915 RepID=UPI002D1F9D38|nr:hypothetical protein [Nitrosomonas europaea]